MNPPQVLRNFYASTIDRSNFREATTRVVIFLLPVLFWGKEKNFHALYIVTVGVLVRAWAAGHLNKDQFMAKSGPYLLVRHPLYLGSCLLTLGLIVVLKHWAVALGLGLLTFITYFHGIQHEEENLKKHFGREYVEYAKKAGPLWPKLSGIKTFFSFRSRKHFSCQRYIKNKEWECLLGVIAVFFILWLGSP